MSNGPDDQPGQGQGDRSDRSQPEGEQSADQPVAGSTGGHQQQPQGTYQRGPGIGDIFSIPETKTELKIGVLLNVLIAVGFGFAALGMSTLSTGFGGFGSVGAFSIGVTGPMLVAPLVGMYLGVRQTDVLDDQPDNVVLGNAAVTAFVGVFVMLLLSLILALIIGGSGNLGNTLGNLLLPYLITAIGAAAVAAGSGWAVENIVPGPSRAQSAM